MMSKAKKENQKQKKTIISGNAGGRKLIFYQFSGDIFFSCLVSSAFFFACLFVF